MIKEIEARTSDAVSLALRFDCPIYTYEKIMKDASIDESSIFAKESILDEPEVSLSDENEFEYYTLEELDKLLDQAVENEDYEQASKIRDEIEKRKDE